MIAVFFLIILRPLKTHYDVMSCNIIVLQYVEHAVNYDSFTHAHTHVLPLSHYINIISNKILAHVFYKCDVI